MNSNKESKPNRTASSLFYLAQSYLSIILVLFQGVVLVPLYLQQIDVDLYGAWLASGNLIAHLGVFDLGLSAVLNQQVAQAYGAKDRRRVARISGTGLVIGLGLSLAVCSIGLLLAPYVPAWVSLTGNKSNQILSDSVRIAVVASSLTLFVYFFSNVSLALQRSLGVGIVNILAWCVGIISTLFGLRHNWGLYAIPFGYLVRAILMFAGMIAHYAFGLKQDIGLWPSFARREFKELSSLSGFTFLGKLGSTIIGQSDAFIVANLLGPEMTTVYGITSRSRDTLRTIPDRMSSAVMPGLAHLSGENRTERVKEITLGVFGISVGVAAAAAAGIFALNGAFINLWVGSELFGGTLLTFLICIFFILWIARSSMSNLLFAAGLIRTVNKLNLAEALLRIPLVIIFTSSFGLVGVPLGASIGLLLVNGFFLVRAFLRQFNINKNDLQNRWMGLLLFPLLALGIGALWNYVPQPASWTGFIFSAGVISFALAALFWTMNPEARKLILPLLRRLRWKLAFQKG